MKIPTIIVDIDGTLADISTRRRHLEGPKKNWPAFLEGMEKDKPNTWCFDLCEGMSKYCIDRVLFVTGRKEKYNEITTKWIKKHLTYTFCFSLFMRQDGDYRKDAIIKQEIYEQFIKPYYDVLFCVDDRQQVVDMWRSLGLVCLQCDKGNF